MKRTFTNDMDQATVPAQGAKTRLVLRTCNADLTSYGGFQWPAAGFVQAPDFEATYAYGHGLHGLLEGKGDGDYLNWSPAARWLVVEVEERLLLTGQGELCDKCKFPEGNVVHCGTQTSALDYLQQHGVDPIGCVGAVITAGDRGTAIVGYNGIATAGKLGTAIAGKLGTATAGNSGIATVGDYSAAIAGDNGKATAGKNGTASVGNDGTATAGHYGKAIAGISGRAIAGDHGIATAGTGGTAIAGNYGTVTAGKNGRILGTWYDANALRYRTVIGYIGEDGIQANTPYQVDTTGNFVVDTKILQGALAK